MKVVSYAKQEKPVKPGSANTNVLRRRRLKVISKANVTANKKPKSRIVKYVNKKHE